MNPAAVRYFKPVFAGVFLIWIFPSAAGVFTGATALGAAALFTVYFFILLQPFFPVKLLRWAVILFLAGAYQTAETLFHPEPFWILCWVLLLDWSDFHAKHLGPKPLPPLVRTGVFWSAAMLMGLARAVLAGGMGLRLFEQPPGMLLLGALLTVLMLVLEKPLEPLWRSQKTP